MNQSSYLKQFYTIIGAGVCLLSLSAWLLIKHILSLREFEITGLIWWIVMSVALFLVIRSRQQGIADERKKQIADGVSAKTLDRDRCVKNIRTMQLLTAVFAVLFVVEIFPTGGSSSSLSTVAAAGFYVFCMAVCLVSLVRSKNKLKNLNGG